MGHFKWLEILPRADTFLRTMLVTGCAVLLPAVFAWRLRRMLSPEFEHPGRPSIGSSACAPPNRVEEAEATPSGARPDHCGYGIVLFYEYTAVMDVGSLVEALERLCNRLQLSGRIRVSLEGVNGCLSGTMTDCEQFVADMQTESGGIFSATDFKLAPCEECECFRALKVWESDEVCGLFTGTSAEAVIAREKLADADPGQHLSPSEWHQMLKSGGEDLVLFDVRNRYETRIGHFSRQEDGEVSSGAVDLIDPLTRFFFRYTCVFGGELGAFS